tara:strand:+ start:20311 stop:20655 length:345 start_codon:yes stop_codon:yes gene_type:complete
MDAALDVLSWIFIVTGLVFCLIGGYGLLKMRDMFARLHAASLIDTLGVGFVFIGLMFQAGFTLVLAKLVIILLLIFFTSPTATFALARAAINHDSLPAVDDDGKKLAADTKTVG